jgi:hypothetical protein
MKVIFLYNAESNTIQGDRPSDNRKPLVCGERRKYSQWTHLEMHHLKRTSYPLNRRIQLDIILEEALDRASATS